MRSSVFHIQNRSDKHKWLVVAMTLLAMVCGAWSLLETQPPDSAIVVQSQPKLDAVGFERPWQLGAATASAAPGPAAPMPLTAAVPRSPPPPQPTTTDTEDPQELAHFSNMDAKLRPGAPLPEWAPVGELMAEVSRAESNTTVSGVACADEFCRLDLQTASGMEQGNLVEELIAPLAARGSALMFRYPQNQTNQVMVYMLKPEPTESVTPHTVENP